MIKRKALDILENWKTDTARKPLVLRGARQVGKTSLVREFAKSYEQYIEINFDETPEKLSYFKNRNIEDTIKFIEAEQNIKITKSLTLLFFDEVQEAPDVLPMLRYFYEKRPDIHVIVAGSLLEFILTDHNFSMPVGRIDYYFLGPLSFEEYLGGAKQSGLLELISSYRISDEIPEALHLKIMNFHREYSLIGGMPEAVSRWFQTEDFLEVQKVHTSILQTYEDDFSKYKKRINPEILRTTLRSLPRLVGEKLKYVNIDPEYSSTQLKSSINALVAAKIMVSIYHCDGNGVPMGAEVNTKKLKPLLLDVGLLSTSLSLNLTHLNNLEDVMLVNNGALAEQYIGQELLTSFPYWRKPELYYWHREARGSNAEIDYLIDDGPNIIPIEVKAGKTGSLRSLHTFMAEKKYKLALRFNTDTPSQFQVNTDINTIGNANYLLISLPLYLSGQAKRLLNEIETKK